MATNVLVVVVDALRTDRVGEYGGRAVTPTIDSLAENGTLFERAYSTINATDPALTSLHTGCLPRTHGVLNHGSHVTNDEKRAIEGLPTLPVALRESGIDTGAFGRPLGRWHRRGFDRYPELSSAHWRLKSFEKSISRLLYGIYPPLGDAVSGAYNTLTDRTGSDDEDGVVDRFTDFIDDSEQFYSFVHLMNTHTPYDVNVDLVERYLEQYEYENRPLAAVAEEFPAESITANSLRPGGVVNRDNDRWKDHDVGVGTALARAQYDAAATEADRTIDALLDALSRRGRLEETFVVVLADHGESLGEHDIYFEHHGLYEPTVRIPLVIRPPFESVDRVRELVSITDIAPTIFDILGRDGFESDGRSLRPLVGGSDEWTAREALLLEEANTQRFRGVRTDRWKYVRAVEDDPTCRYCQRQHGASEQLYDLESDPGETNNLVEERPDRVSSLRDELSELLSKYNPRRTDGTEGETVRYDDEDEVLDRLESLGYR